MRRLKILWAFLVLVTFGGATEPYFKNCDAVQQGLVGESAKIRCEPARQGTNLIWFENTTQIYDGDKYKIEDDGLVIKEVAESDSSAIFIVWLKLSLDVGEAYSHPMKLIKFEVKMRPVISLEREVIVSVNQTDIAVNCFAQGIPTPRITWYNPASRYAISREGERLELKIPNITPEQPGVSGLYKCWAENEIGYDSNSLLLVFEDPKYSGKHPWEIESIDIKEVSENAVTFNVRIPSEGPKADALHATVILIGRPTEPNKEITWNITGSESDYKISYLQSGAAYRFLFRTSHLNVNNSGPFYHNAVDVYLLPTPPKLMIKKLDNDVLHLTWIQGSLININSNPVDYHEIDYHYVQRKIDEWGDPTCSTRITLQTKGCYSNQYKFDRTTEGTMNYRVLRMRTHNRGGYSQWEEIWIPPKDK